MSRLVIRGKAQDLPHNGGLVALIPAIATIVSLASLLLLLQTGRVITSSYDLRQLEQVHAELLAQNQQLEAELAALQSIDRIKWVAENKLGMGPADQQFYVTLPPTEPPGAAAHPDNQSRAKTDPLGNWWEDFLTWIGFRERATNQ